MMGEARVNFEERRRRGETHIQRESTRQRERQAG
jgi:hypothetical protein